MKGTVTCSKSMSLPVVLTAPLFLLWKVLFPVAILVILRLKHWSPPSSAAVSAAFSVFQTPGMRRVSAAAHGAFLRGKQQWRAFKEAGECFGSPFLPHIHPAGSWWVPTFHSHASFLPGDEMCVEVSVRVQLTVPLRPGSTAAVLPCSSSRDKRWVYFSQVQNGAALLLSISS